MASLPAMCTKLHFLLLLSDLFFCWMISAGRPHQLEIILEKRGKKEDAMLQEHFQRLHARGTGYISPERIQAYCQSITFKSKADDIGGLQLADLVAYPIARYVLDSRRANPSFDVLAPKIYTKNGQRYGLKVFP